MIGIPQLFGTVRAMRRHPRATREELTAFQDALLRRLLVHAYERVPYYRKLFDRHRLHPRHVRGTTDLDLIPITSKHELRDLPERQRLASDVDPAGLLTVRTSGSSGEPFTIRRTWLEDKIQYLFALRALQLLGAHIGDRRATVTLVRGGSRERKVLGRTLRALGITRARLIDGLQEPAAVAEELRAFRPEVITGMSGMLSRLADYLIASGGEPVRPRHLIVGGEVLTPVMRRRLTSAFHVPVRQTYASNEFPLLGWECTHTGEFHTCDDNVILEVLHDEGRPARPGEQGEVVATNLHAYGMPLIRYRLGDVVVRGDERCACGQPFSNIRAIQGRMIDYFTLPDGRVLHPYQILTSIIAGADSWIRQYQLLQERKDRIVLRVLPMESSVSEQVAQIERSVKPLLGPGVEFRVQLLDDLPLEHTGKFQPARSLVQPEHNAEERGPFGV